MQLRLPLEGAKRLPTEISEGPKLYSLSEVSPVCSRHMEHPLAIVIPAYRKQFLGEALESLALQTNQQFTVYIGDDASPENLRDTIEAYTPRLAIQFTRFEQNLGALQLVEQWHRCIQLSQTEPWIWLFSDDDIAEPDCVASFYRALQETTAPEVSLYRFQMEFIDAASQRFDKPATHPAYETSLALMTALLADPSRQWRAPDHIFSRKIYDERGGFVSFPKALHSDFATWLHFSHPAGVRTIEGPRLLWRSHAQGTSSGQRGTNRILLIQTLSSYLQWMQSFAANSGPLFDKTFKDTAPGYLFLCLTFFQPQLTAEERRQAITTAQQLFGRSRLRATIELNIRLFDSRFRPRLRHWPFVQPLARTFRKLKAALR